MPIPGYGVANAVTVPLDVDLRLVEGTADLAPTSALGAYVRLYAEEEIGSGVFELVSQPTLDKGPLASGKAHLCGHVMPGRRYYFDRDPNLLGSIPFYHYHDLRTYRREEYAGAPP